MNRNRMTVRRKLSLAFGLMVTLILLVAGPAIPVFMALIGHAARDASRRQLDDMAGMGALLADRIGLHLSFILPLLCYGYIIFYGLVGSRTSTGVTQQD